MADLEDALRNARDQLAETELENANFQTIVLNFIKCHNFNYYTFSKNLLQMKFKL